jgi:hypothetical protein
MAPSEARVRRQGAPPRGGPSWRGPRLDSFLAPAWGSRWPPSALRKGTRTRPLDAVDEGVRVEVEANYSPQDARSSSSCCAMSETERQPGGSWRRSWDDVRAEASVGTSIRTSTSVELTEAGRSSFHGTGPDYLPTNSDLACHSPPPVVDPTGFPRQGGRLWLAHRPRGRQARPGWAKEKGTGFAHSGPCGGYDPNGGSGSRARSRTRP